MLRESVCMYRDSILASLIGKFVLLFLWSSSYCDNLSVLGDELCISCQELASDSRAEVLLYVLFITILLHFAITLF
jgi:hypothetical protein